MTSGIKSMYLMLLGLARQKEGATMIEYAFIASFVALALIGVLSTLGTSLEPTYTTVSATLQ